MSQYSLIVCDLDGTLLNSKSEMNEEDRRALVALKDKGVRVAIATGRCELQILEYIAKLQIDTPIIGCNGGLIKKPNSDDILHIMYFQPEMVRAVMAYCTENHLDFLMYSTKFVYHCPWSKRIEKFKRYNETVPAEYRVPIRCTDEFSPDEPLQDIIKILIIDDIDRIIPEVNAKFNQDGALTVVTSGENLTDIMPGHTTKGNAVKILAEKLDIPIEEVVVFGDSPNDETMFRAAGCGIAMGNAKPQIKEIATYVTKTNDECGIAYALEHILHLLP